MRCTCFFLMQSVLKTQNWLGVDLVFNTRGRRKNYLTQDQMVDSLKYLVSRREVLHAGFFVYL